MAQQRSNRKKKVKRNKPDKYDPLDRAVRKRVVRRRIGRRKRLKNEKEWKETLYIISGMLVAAALIIILYYVSRITTSL